MDLLAKLPIVGARWQKEPVRKADLVRRQWAAAAGGGSDSRTFLPGSHNGLPADLLASLLPAC